MVKDNDEIKEVYEADQTLLLYIPAHSNFPKDPWLKRLQHTEVVDYGI